MQDRVRAGLRITKDLNTWLILEAEKQGISKNALILKILYDKKEQREAIILGEPGFGMRYRPKEEIENYDESGKGARIVNNPTPLI